MIEVDVKVIFQISRVLAESNLHSNIGFHFDTRIHPEQHSLHCCTI